MYEVPVAPEVPVAELVEDPDVPVVDAEVLDFSAEIFAFASMNSLDEALVPAAVVLRLEVLGAC